MPFTGADCTKATLWTPTVRRASWQQHVRLRKSERVRVIHQRRDGESELLFLWDAPLRFMVEEVCPQETWEPSLFFLFFLTPTFIVDSKNRAFPRLCSGEKFIPRTPHKTC